MLYQNENNTPISQTLLPPETVTVRDPRHPLYEQTLVLLAIKNKPGHSTSCLVQLFDGVERPIPLQATNLSTTPLATYSLPLDLSSLHNLIQTFARIRKQVEEQHDEGAGSHSDIAPASLANTDSDTATEGSKGNRASLSPSDHNPKRGGIN